MAVYKPLLAIYSNKINKYSYIHFITGAFWVILFKSFISKLRK